MPRPTWTGSISFGLVNVPVKAYTAVRDHDVHFHQVDKRSGARIRNRKVSERTGKEVDNDDIELAFEVKPGKYVTFEKDELEELKPESTRSIEVSDFVSLHEIDPIYYERTYWLAPSEDAAKPAYQLLLAAMANRELIGVGRVVMRNKQYLTAVRPLDGVLAMSTMRFADEVVPRSEIDDLPKRAAKPDPKALRMATQIVEGLAGPWEPDKYRDDYADELRERISSKRTKQAASDEPAAESPTGGGKVVDLMAALEASVQAAKSARGGDATKRSGSSRPASRSAAKQQRAPARRGAAKRTAKRSAKSA